MNKRLTTSALMQIAGALLVRVNIYGLNPFGIGIYTAIMCSRLIKWPTLIIMSISMLFYWSVLDAAKYVLVMLGISVMIKLIEDGRRRINEVAGSLIGAGLYMAMECSEVFMENGSNEQYIFAMLAGVLAFTSSMLMHKIIEAMLISGKKISNSNSRRKSNDDENIYEEKIKKIASSFERVAKSITTMSSSSEDRMVNCIACPTDYNPEVQVVNELWKNRIYESQKAIALQLGEMSKILKDCTTDAYTFVGIDENRERYLRIKLKNKGVILKKIIVINNRRGINEINITIKASWNKCIMVKEVEAILSDAFCKKICLLKEKGKIVSREYTTYNFVEEPNYFVLHGTAKKASEENGVSGDNFTCMELQSGQALVSVSDGMGHGINAYRQSEMVLSLLEELMEGGFSETVALKLINTVFMIDSSNIAPASVDMGIIDLYSGVCDFMKIGAATTFVKRGGWVEAIKSTSMPIGAEEIVDIETTSKKLYDGDFVIMMSDGIIDAIKCEDKEKVMSKIIMETESTKPQDMAREILARAIAMSNLVDKKKMRDQDDMLVLVTGIWDKCA